MILSLVNVKGGVGKTTTAVNLGATLARSGLRVLIIDLDPQGSASFSLGITEKDARPSAADLLLNDKPIREVIRETGRPGLDLVTGSMELAEGDLTLARKRDPERQLARALAPVRRRYDFIIVDCPPGLSVLSLNGLAASKAYMVPVVPHDLDMEALNRFFGGMDRIQHAIHRHPQLLGIVLTMVDHRTRVTDEVVAGIRGAFGREVFRTEIPINVRLAEAPGYGKSIFDYQSWSKGAQAYSHLGAEVITRSRKAELI